MHCPSGYSALSMRDASVSLGIAQIVTEMDHCDLVPRGTPKIVRDITRLLLTERRPLEVLLYQYVSHQLGVAQTAADDAAVGVKCGQSTQSVPGPGGLQPA
jgi:hypothetical protein